MRLWTFQPRAVYALIQETGVYRCEAGKSMFLDENDPSSGVFRDAYAWMVRQMEKRLGSRPEVWLITLRRKDVPPDQR